MPTNSYDLIVVGDDFAGLVAGALCARRGMRVLLLTQGRRPTSYTIGPHRLPVTPLVLAGLGSDAVQRVLEELHLGHTLKRRLEAGAHGFQFVGPDIRLDLSADEDLLASALVRELPSVASAGRSDSDGDDAAAARGASAADIALAACRQSATVAEGFDAAIGADAVFPPTGFWKRREVGKSASRLADQAAGWFEAVAEQPLVSALMSLPAVLGTHTAATELSTGARARSFHLWRQGVPHLRGHWEALRELLLDSLQKTGGETRTARASALTYRWGRVSGVELDGGEELGAGHVIAAMPIAALAELCARKVPKRLSQCEQALTIAGYRYTLNLVVDEAGVPEGMSSPLVLVGDPAAPLSGDNAIGIHLARPDDEGRVVVTVAAVCPPPDDLAALPAAFAALRERLRDRLDTVMPFLDGHILLAHSPQEERPPEGPEAAAARGLPEQPIPVWSSALEAALDISAVPYQVGLKHLTVASSQVLPQLGIEGDFIAGWSAAHMASESMGKKREYREVLASG